MVNTFISGIMEFLRNIVDILINPVVNALSNLPGMSGLQDFYEGCSTLLVNITEGGIFVKRFLMIPDGLISSFFILLSGLAVCWGIVAAIQFVVRVYNAVKGPI